MRNFFRRLRDSFRKPKFSNKQKTKMRSGAAKGAIARMDKQGKDTSKFKPTGFAKIKADVAGDFNPSKRDLGYQARLSDRQEGAQKALDDMKRRRNKRRDRNNDTTATAETEEVTNVTEETAETTLGEDTNTALTNLENTSTATFENNNDISNYFDNTATSAVNTAAGIDTNMASALTTSVGEAEDEAISYMDSGTASNVTNAGGAQGLLGGDDEDEDDPFNRRKTLIGA